MPARMRVQVRVLCSPYPWDAVEATLRSAGKQLALTDAYVSVHRDAAEPRVVILDFEMHHAPQVEVVDGIYKTVKRYAWAFYQDITIRFLEAGA